MARIAPMATPRLDTAHGLPPIVPIILANLVELRDAEELEEERFESQVNRICEELLRPRGLNLVISKNSQRQPGISVDFTRIEPPAPRRDSVRSAQTRRRSTRERSARNSVRRVLVIEEHRESAVCLARLLGRWGFAVYLAADADAAAELARNCPPDIVIVDLEQLHDAAAPLLPGVRTTGAGRRTSFIGLAHHELSPAQLERRGLQHCLVKPLDAVALKRILAGGN